MSIELSCEISYSGELLVIAAQVAGTAPTGGFDQLQIISSLSGTPTLYRNGTAVTLYGPIWNDGTDSNFGFSNAMVAYYLSSGPVLPSDVMTVSIPANFVNGSSPNYTTVPVANWTGQVEGPFGRMPGLNGTPTTGAGCNLGQPAIDYSTTNYLNWNQMFRSGGWGGNGTATYDQYGYPISWDHTTGFHNRCYGPLSDNSLDGRGWPNEIGVWSLIWGDPAAGTGLATTVTPVLDPGGNATISVGSPVVTGTTTILPFTIGYNSSNPTSWYTGIGVNVSAPANNLGGSDGLAHWALGKGPYMVPPNSTDGSQVSAAQLNQIFTSPYKLHSNVKAQLSSGGNAASHLRAMESILGSGNLNNCIYKIDMPDARAASWEFFPTARTVSATFQFVRFLNTNPSSSTYTWSSTKCYGPQGDFVLSDGVTTPLTVTLTSGSINCTITNATFPAIMAGGIISGTGIAAGTRLAYFNASTGAAVLDTPATASGSQSLTLANPKYAPLPVADNGGFTINGYGQQNWAVIEMRSTLPHGLTTGQVPGGSSTTHSNGVAITNVTGLYDPQLPQAPIYVTGPYTVAFATPVTSTGGAGPQTVNSTTEYNFTSTGGWVAQVVVPADNLSCLPPEALVAMCVDLGCPRAWVNLPGWGTNELFAQCGARCAGQANGTINVMLERGDEPWNGGNPFYVFLIGNIAHQNLYDYYPNGTVVNNYLTTSSTKVGPNFGQNGLGGHVLASGMMRDAFISGWTGAGGSASKVKHILNDQFSYTGSTPFTLGAAQQWGVPTDYLSIAPYVETPSCTAIINAMNASGGNLSLSAINDYVRLYWFCDYKLQSFYQQHQAFLQAWGQPSVPLSISDVAGPGGLPGGGWAAAVTWLDASGNETTIGQSASSAIGLNTGDFLGVPMPVTPNWVRSVNFYAGGNPYGQAQLFKAKNVLTIAGGGTTQPGQQVLIGSVGGTLSPTTNGVPSSSSGPPPVLCSYEGGDDVTVPTGVTGYKALTHDVHAHPSRWLAVYTWYMTTQIGCQWSPGSGIAFATWYAGWAGPGFATGPFVWRIYDGPGQPAGQGLSNQYATSRPGHAGGPASTPADGQDHNGGRPAGYAGSSVQPANVNPGGYGLVQWIAGSGTAPPPTVSRRFLPKLR